MRICLCRRGAARFNLDMPTPADIDGLSFEALKALVIQLLGKVAEQERLIAELREEIARLKGLNGRPRIRPSGMESAREPPPPGKRGKRRRRGKIVPRVVVQDRVIKAQVPAGSRFKGYETYLVQDVVLRAGRCATDGNAGSRRMGSRYWLACPLAWSGILDRSCAASCWCNIIKGKSPFPGWWHNCGGSA